VIVAIPIVVVILVAGASLFLLANRQRAATGNLSRETVRTDESGPAAPGEATATGTELEVSADARARADEARAGASGVPAKRGRGAITVWEPVDEEELGVTRRQFLNRGILVTMLAALGTFGASLLAFLWPSNSAGFGGKIAAGKLSDIISFMATNKQPWYVPEARTYIQPYPADAVTNAKSSKVYPDYILAGMEQGIVALYQKCVHLGCRVPWCQSAQWFECPCHGSKYNRVGEKRDGPAPRGLDRFQALIAGGNVTINTGLLAQGPPIGTNTTGQVAEGPHCVG
jgi:cytochrome b6-f complex iron-sulfur subunit